MEPETESSSRNRSSLLPLFLLGIGVWIGSKIKSPHNESTQPPNPQDTSSAEQHDLVTSVQSIAQSAIEHNRNSERSHEAYPPWKKWADKAQVIIAICTFGLLVVNIFLIVATKRSAEAAKQSLQMQRIAFQVQYPPSLWIGVDLYDLGPSKTPWCWVRIINVGKLDAIKPTISAKINFGIGSPVPETGDYIFDSNIPLLHVTDIKRPDGKGITYTKRNIEVLYYGQQGIGEFHARDIPPNSYIDYRNRAKQIYVWGVIRFEDALGTRTVPFCRWADYGKIQTAGPDGGLPSNGPWGECYKSEAKEVAK